MLRRLACTKNRIRFVTRIASAAESKSFKCRTSSNTIPQVPECNLAFVIFKMLQSWKTKKLVFWSRITKQGQTHMHFDRLVKKDTFQR